MDIPLDGLALELSEKMGPFMGKIVADAVEAHRITMATEGKPDPYPDEEPGRRTCAMGAAKMMRRLRVRGTVRIDARKYLGIK